MTINYTGRMYWSRILNASLCKFFILGAVCAGPAHGYEIIQRVARLTDNFCVPTQGTVYPVMREFEACGCVTCHLEVVNGRRRKVYSVTPKGREAYRSGLDVWKDGLAHIGKFVEG